MRRRVIYTQGMRGRMYIEGGAPLRNIYQSATPEWPSPWSTNLCILSKRTWNLGTEMFLLKYHWIKYVLTGEHTSGEPVRKWNWPKCLLFLGLRRADQFT